MVESTLPEKRAKLLAEHYQKTFELTYDLWKDRNRTFLALMGTVGVEALLGLREPATSSLLVDAVAKLLGITDAARISKLHASFPFGLLQTILLVVVLYLMESLYRHTLWVSRNYVYLARVEDEIRKDLAMSGDSFTREGEFYWANRDWLLGYVKWFYIAALGGLLGMFLFARLRSDWTSGQIMLTVVDACVGAATAIFFAAYAVSSVRLDKKK